MTPTEQLKAILAEKYTSEDGDDYRVELKPGLTDKEIDTIAKRVPNQQIPNDIVELLKFSSGFAFQGLDEVTFDGIGQFGLEEIFPISVQLAGDGYGNFWVLDINASGKWGNVFYVCHDPAVVVKHSENLADFIKHVDEFGKKGNESNLDIIHENISMDIWTNDNGFIDKATALERGDEILKSFTLSLPDNFVIVDLRSKPIKSGFAWGKFGPRINVKRHPDELIWGFEKVERKGFLSRLFGN